MSIKKTLDYWGKDLVFKESSHQYFYKGKEMKSATTILKDYFPFPREEAAQKALEGRNPKYEHCETVEDVYKVWAEKADFGTSVHNLCEDYLSNKFVSPQNQTEVEALKYVAKLKPEEVYPEIQITWPNKGIAGMVDCLIKLNGKWYIYDWKTDKEINKENANRYWDERFGREVDESSYYCPGILYGFDNCNFNKYQFQLGIYRFILEHVYEIPIAGSVVVHFTEEGATEYKLNYPQDYVALVINKFVTDQKSKDLNT